MLGGLDGGELETRFRAAVEACALDTIEAGVVSGASARAILVTDTVPRDLPAGAQLDLDLSTAFQFGRRLAGAVATHDVRRLIYVGGGALPLPGSDVLPALGTAARAGGPGVPGCLANNLYSADAFALTEASLLARLDPPPDRDNLVPRRLRDELGVPVMALPFGAASQCNLDTPLDLLLLGLGAMPGGAPGGAPGGTGPRLTARIGDWAEDGGEALERLRRVGGVLTSAPSELLVAGRIGSRAWRELERETACRVRVLAEERGMTAAGRERDLTARSLLGQLLAAVGPERCFGELLPELCDAALIDIRPVLAHLGIRASRADRFAADLGLAARIEEPRLRAIVAAAVAAPVPVVLGGHTLLSGGLLLLNAWAWAAREAAAQA